MAAHGITFGVISRPQDVPEDEQAVACGAIVETAIPEMPRTLANPIRLGFAEQQIARPAPALGQHSDQILAEAGLSARGDRRAAGKRRRAMSDEPTGEALPLSGLIVLDISSFIAAPAAAVALADFGADVIKIEPPGDGDPHRNSYRNASYPQSDRNFPWQLDGRLKRSLALDLKNAGARAVLERLIARADIMIVNFPPPARERLRLRWEDIETLNPRLIYCSLTGYGETGPDRDRPGFDVTAYFGRSGILDAARYEGGPPGLSLPAQGDRATAMTLVAAILLGLRQRDRTGKGCWVGTLALCQWRVGQRHLGGGRPARRQAAAAPGARPAAQRADQPLPHQGRSLAAAPDGARRSSVGALLRRHRAARPARRPALHQPRRPPRAAARAGAGAEDDLCRAHLCRMGTRLRTAPAFPSA